MTDKYNELLDKFLSEEEKELLEKIVSLDVNVFFNSFKSKSLAVLYVRKVISAIIKKTDKNKLLCERLSKANNDGLYLNGELERHLLKKIKNNILHIRSNIQEVKRIQYLESQPKIGLDLSSFFHSQYF